MSAAIAGLWSQAERLLLLARQDPALAAAAARYVLLAAPALWCTGMFEAGKRYLMAQGVVRPVSAVTLVGLALAPLFAWLLIFRAGLGLDGAALAVDATQLTMAALLGTFIAVRDASLRGTPTATWHGWSTQALRGWGQYLRCVCWVRQRQRGAALVRLVCAADSARCRRLHPPLHRFALPSVVMICCEWWCELLGAWGAGRATLQAAAEASRQAPPPWSLLSPCPHLATSLPTHAGLLKP